MSQATELYKSGQLQAATEAQIQEVKANPGDPNRRLFLFELAMFSGDLDRARRQIDAVKYEDPTLIRGVEMYKLLVESEVARQKLFTEGVRPGTSDEPPEHVALRLDAIDRLRHGDQAGANELLTRANESAPSVAGTLNGTPFSELRDGDDLLGTVLEVMSRGKYYWLPLDQVDSIAMNPPKFPRDLIWVPARLTMRSGESGEVYLPALYHGTAKHADETIRLGRSTDWVQAENGPVLGVGLKSFLCGEDSNTILDWRELIIEGEDHTPA